MSDLLPCPFCGCEATLEYWTNDACTHDWAGVRCTCGAQMSVETSWPGDDELAQGARMAAAWNQRVCSVCGGGEWVCENHADKPWPDGCHCGAGMPCKCSPLHNDNIAHEAALSAARAEGRREGLLEAAGLCAKDVKLMGAHGFGTVASAMADLEDAIRAAAEVSQ